MNNQKGFTLLELLVVLVLVASVAGLFLDPIARVYDLKSRLQNFIDGAPAVILPPTWFQATVKGIYVGEEKFEGTSKDFSSETIASFDEPAGVPMPFAWEIDYEQESDTSSLSYRNAIEENMVMLSWKGDSGSFSYYDPEEEKWVEEWQSSPFTKKDEYRLPTLIRLEATRDGKPFVMQASLEISRSYLKDTRDEIDRLLDQQLQKLEDEKAIKAEFGGEDLDQESKNEKVSVQGKIKAGRNNKNDDKLLPEAGGRRPQSRFTLNASKDKQFGMTKAVFRIPYHQDKQCGMTKADFRIPYHKVEGNREKTLDDLLEMLDEKEDQKKRAKEEDMKDPTIGLFRPLTEDQHESAEKYYEWRRKKEEKEALAKQKDDDEIDIAEEP